VGYFEADALSLPFADASFDLVTLAFGFRNLANYESGLKEFARILKPGGRLGILEFSEPRGAVFGPLYRWYFTHVLPRLGRIISGHSFAYSYLPSSVSKFPAPDALAKLMRAAGFSDVSYELWTGGSVGFHRGTRK
jgi:demethylmenaquinone methyltransferase/2-methoxy-6-polyprenyl-1,4-benzoquinol methylase